MSKNDVLLLFVIADRKQEKKLIEELSAMQASLVNVIYGKGFIKNNNIWDMVGFYNELSKVVLTALINRDKSGDILGMLEDKFNFDRPNTGIAFTVAIDKIKVK